VSAVHQNTDNWHLHVAINKVHPRTLRNVEPWYDHYRLQEICPELEIRHGLTRTNHRAEAVRRQRGRAGDFEAHQGGVSFLPWVREEARLGLLEARERGDWQELHISLARCGLQIKPRGAGLVIGRHGESRLHVKASDVDRLLSKQSLTEALGPFQPPGERARQQVLDVEYEPGTSKRSGALYEAFRKERDRARQERAAALLAALSVQHRVHAEQLRAWYRERFRQERTSGLTGALRRDALQHLRDKQREDRAAGVRREAKERQNVRA
jgi:hypothetical protein